MADTFGIVQKTLLFGILAATTALFFWTLHGFAMALFWAVVFAVVLYPSFKRLCGRIRSGTLAALITIAVVLVVVFAPLFFLGSLIAEQAISLYQRIPETGIPYVSMLEDIPLISGAIAFSGIDPEEIEKWSVSALRTASSWIASEALSIGLKTFTTLVQFLLMLYLLFFFLKDGERLVAFIRRLLPLGDARERQLFARFSETVRAMMKGTLIVALAQGAVGGILFWIAGIPNAILWGTAMALLALIPVVGPVLVWLPAGVILILMGNIWQGIVVLLGGTVVISLIDNFLRPLLVARDIHMPDALILLAILGGITTFGIAGIIIGPVLAVLFLAMWEIFAEEFSNELSERG